MNDSQSFTPQSSPVTDPNHPFFLAQDLESWQHLPYYEPNLKIDSWPGRHKIGKALRLKTPREVHNRWEAPSNRPDPVEFIKATHEGRQANLVPIRMGRMSASPFSFFRGTAGVMAWDLAHTPVSGIQVLIDGDAHLNNFGLSGTPQRTVVFDLDDFDEVTYGCWEWDLKRLAASINVAARESGLKKNDRCEAVMASVAGYQENAEHLESLRILQVWYLHHYPGEESTVFKPDAKIKEILEKAVKKALDNTNVSLLEDLACRSVEGKWQFIENPPLLIRTDEVTSQKIIGSLISYAETLAPERRYMFQRYRVVDVAHRVVGISSVGLRTYLVMLLGNDDSDPLFLQVKEGISPVFAPYGPSLPPTVTHQGQRVVFGQRVLQAATDVLLGWTSIDGRPFYVRQLKNLKGSIPLNSLKGSAFMTYARACGTLLARAHARSGDIAKIAGYCGTSPILPSAIANFAEAYGEQTEKDWDSLVKAIKEGHIPAEFGI
ncbi:DUF2252 domain-containing protein [Aphanothece sacrum]|uniref:DUF2252 domain-containing protein n=1 Tax=Aphanothece sacrum FPU1 TaxID=1920663 RepID=A0A401IG56_APHSA|nr:DUF2252 domain-containing protein [Aphanothece sacrum]GBF80196.1 hypothetical protein AsFPU1_1597 [Aphanothece sacrum FPU1]GBF85349.1 Hypothetical protein AsFPU3_2408 [Aphanothece sacrum FPU3]